MGTLLLLLMLVATLSSLPALTLVNGLATGELPTYSVYLTLSSPTLPTGSMLLKFGDGTSTSIVKRALAPGQATLSGHTLSFSIPSETSLTNPICQVAIAFKPGSIWSVTRVSIVGLDHKTYGYDLNITPILNSATPMIYIDKCGQAAGAIQSAPLQSADQSDDVITSTPPRRPQQQQQQPQQSISAVNLDSDVTQSPVVPTLPKKGVTPATPASNAGVDAQSQLVANQNAAAATLAAQQQQKAQAAALAASQSKVPSASVTAQQQAALAAQQQQQAQAAALAAQQQQQAQAAALAAQQQQQAASAFAAQQQAQAAAVALAAQAQAQLLASQRAGGFGSPQLSTQGISQQWLTTALPSTAPMAGQVARPQWPTTSMPSSMAQGGQQPMPARPLPSTVTVSQRNQQQAAQQAAVAATFAASQSVSARGNPQVIFLPLPAGVSAAALSGRTFSQPLTPAQLQALQAEYVREQQNRQYLLQQQQQQQALYRRQQQAAPRQAQSGGVPPGWTAQQYQAYLMQVRQQQQAAQTAGFSTANGQQAAFANVTPQRS